MERMSFDEAMSKLEDILDDLEANSDKMDPDEVEKAIRDDTILISVMFANNDRRSGKIEKLLLGIVKKRKKGAH